MTQKFVLYNGVQVIEGWPNEMEKAQQLTTYVIGGEVFERIKYGDEDEDWGAGSGPCHDCAAIKGQYHAPFLCDVERCPSCWGQVISCDCEYEGDDSE